MDALPDFASLTDDDLTQLIRTTETEEETISQRRRFLHGRIDLLRAARVERLREQVESGTLDLPTPSTLERSIFEGSGDPPEASAAAMTAPSTMGALQMTARSRRSGGSISTAISLLVSAPPRSTSTATPFSLQTLSMAPMIAPTSVPSPPSGLPPHAATRTS